jgi:hypothetical protein
VAINSNVSTINDTWEERIEQLINYRNKYGSMSPRIRNINEEDIKWVLILIGWCKQIRYRYRMGTLKKWKYEELVSIGFSFNLKESEFELRMKELEEFRRKYGHTLITGEYKEFAKLASWAIELRKNPPIGDRKAKLDKAGFVWDVIDYRWNAKFQELIKYKKKYGHTCVSKKWKKYRYLGLWVERMRSAKRFGKKGVLNEQKIQLLDSIGFVWEPRMIDTHGKFELLLKYKEENGHCHIPVLIAKQLGINSWIQYIRKTKYKLSAEQVAMFEGIGFEWDARVAALKRQEIESLQTKTEKMD